MNGDINHYHIHNPDGADRAMYNEGRSFFKNDNPRYVQENSTAKQSEWDSSACETSDISDGQPVKEQCSNGLGNNGGDNYFSSSSSPTGASSSGYSSSASSSSASVSSTASSASSAASSAGAAATSAGATATAAVGSAGAVTGTVAASVAATVVAVAAFVSTLVIDISLVMATMFSLVFQVKMTGAQEEDFVTPIVAVLENEKGFYREQTITADTIYITFDDLEPNTEYFITVKNEEKIFVNKKSYFTASEDKSNGSLTAYYEDDKVFVSVKDVKLKASEYYTVQAKDDSGNVVFAKDDITDRDFTFTVNKPINLRFTLSISGKVCAVAEVVAEPKTLAYDFDNGVFEWADDYSSANVVFTDLRGGKPLTVTASVTKRSVAPTCEEDGYKIYSATAEYGGQTYTDTKTSVTAGSALGHDYGTLIEEVPSDVENEGMAAHYFCERCGKYFDRNKNEVKRQSLVIPVLVLEAWSGKTSLPDTAGNYYLTEDVTIMETWVVPEGTLNLSLNGHGIKLGSQVNNIISVGTGATLNIYDLNAETEHRFTVRISGDTAGAGYAQVDDSLTEDYEVFTGGYITGGYSYDEIGAPAIHVDGGVATMHGGTILGNQGGGGYCGAIHVENYGRFTLVGGAITYNVCQYAGAAIYVDDHGILEITGGVIAYNTSTSEDIGGVATDETATLYLSGDPVIFENSGRGDLSVSAPIIINGALNNSAPVWIVVNMDCLPDGVFTDGWSIYMSGADPSDYFTVDEERLIILIDGEAAVHEHYYGDLIEEVSAGCETEGMAAHYYCEVCGKFFDEEYNEVSEDSLMLTVLGHDYGEPAFEWKPDGNGGYTAVATFICSRDEEHIVDVEATVTQVQDNYYTAHVIFDNKDYYDEYYGDNQGG